ncbi:hypothetical protein QFC24_000555 [Naganishia onofrii]|uniref:Uncharacterized protein n=1 Tax=Naganishia onofrii TaxID=1851511 RepID=A0ACC2XXR7_9TREE|nr:hypothetical protein QFC24_000555 [Naganishia onofrii]
MTVPFGNIQRGRRIPIPVGTSGSTAFTRNISSGRPKRMPKAAFYAVRKGRVPGIYDTWDEAEQQVLRHVGAIHKKFRSRAEAEAFISQGGAASQDPYTIPETGSEEKLSAPPDNLKTRIWAVKVGRTPGIYKTCGRRGKQSRAAPFQVHAARASTRPSLSSLPGDGSAITLSPVYQLAQSQGFTITRDGHLVVYTDGSSQGNGGKMAKAGSGVWWAAQGHASTLQVIGF